MNPQPTPDLRIAPASAASTSGAHAAFPGGAAIGAIEAEHDARERDRLTAALNRRTPRWKPVLFLAVLAVGAGALVAVGAAPRAQRQRDIAATSEALRALARRVTFAPARLAPPSHTLSLPASLAPDATADLFAQATGYVRERKVDIGDRVAAGDTLAVLDVPLLDEDLERARATLAEAEAARDVLARDLQLAHSTLERWKAVDTPGAVSKQELDERQSAWESARARLLAAEATIASRRAEVQRDEQGQAFSRVLAPFAGTVTARDVEVGDYVSGAGGGRPLFRIADTSTLRASLDVPQSFAAGVAVGGTARVSLREQPGRSFQGMIARTAGALDERTRTLRVEISVPNASGALLSGSYAQVELDLPRGARAVIVPGSALLVRAEGPRVAILDDGDLLHYVPVHVGRDLGSEIELTEGLTGDERVVVNMADELPEGSKVDPVPLPATPAAPAAPATAPAPPAAPAGATK
ncbi:MAG TPA: efflux RND transporter periplasmic adaptor subunit [Planctomycetota bacterium]|nr:efflux RND transporter periplasmic adaptor subunit [Planctomycetota bacterium]